MQCLKCGRDTGGSGVFCAECHAAMEASPVKPDTPVIIPNRKPTPKRTAPKQTKPEEIIQQLQKKIHRLTVWLSIFGILLALTGTVLGYVLYHYNDGLPIGQNYSTITTPSETEGTT